MRWGLWSGILPSWLDNYVKLTLKEHTLLDLEGIVVAGEFDFEGRMLD